jgi:hypothetical protein
VPVESAVSFDGDRHMNEFEVAAYLGRSLSAADRERIETHLSQCDFCRDTVVATQDAVSQSRKPRRIAIASLAAVAAVAALVITPRFTALRDEPVMRDPAEAVAIHAYDVKATGGSSTVLAWSGAASADHYEVTLTDAEGFRIWSGETRDTTIVLPASVSLMPGKAYVWYADAILSDGSRVSTGLQSLSPAR